jgi:Family of unknown function (DUF5681)
VITPWATASRRVTPGSGRVDPAIRKAGQAAPRNLTTLFHEALNETVIVAENGRRRKISKPQAIVKQIVNKAAKGDWRAAKLLLELPQETGSPTEPESPESAFGAADKKTIEQLKAGIQ